MLFDHFDDFFSPQYFEDIVALSSGLSFLKFCIEI